MARYSFLIEYDGSPYKGWQRQNDMPSVQGALETALARLGESGILVQGAGRTDAGVHALGQVAPADGVDGSCTIGVVMRHIAVVTNCLRGATQMHVTTIGLDLAKN
nr:hypothetical protein [Rhizobiaceae bacterium]